MTWERAADPSCLEHHQMYPPVDGKEEEEERPPSHRSKEP